ncbi:MULTISPECIES: glycosyltransferase family 4 protein [Elizabethkingia]|uniref:glycosyltransferase family 4 protein n=1 Tax=Elizabethkingia TaxID=308865 RepID=UPI0007418219|nr:MULTISPECIES: glycosyltransferase family 1 protein [Elizabethkingia]MCL1655661.1 glycosyltransferase family 4 protein [Elizabethkingia miricola]MCP1251851.1 glycosyltransferase family 4 protein [Elizabethkingia sp. S0634]MDX8572500.1 glycosyltransferase family 1 protein [Elizabethkingia sp. HX QKY]
MLNVIFDIGIIGDSKENNKTGIYRVADELFKNLCNNENTKLFYANYGYKYSTAVDEDIEDYLKSNDIELQKVNSRKRRKFLPFRKEKLFRYFYQKMGIYDYKIMHNNDLLSNSHIYHSPYYPFSASLNKFSHLKKIITIHDLIPILFPQFNTNAELLEQVVDNVLHGGYAICVSENTKNDLLKYEPRIDPSRVFVSLLAASPKIFYKCDDKDKFKKISEKYNLPSKYFLSLSTLEPRKNIDHVIRCFIQMIEANNIDDLSLVLVGSKGWMYDKIFEEYENAEHLKNRIIFTGRVDDNDLASIYSHAYSFFYMSLYEGFGLPPLEAMQCGIATVTSNTSSLPEVVGDSGVTLDPMDDKALCNVMAKLYRDDDFRKNLSQKGLQRSKFFSWEKCVEEHIRIYKKILSL